MEENINLSKMDNVVDRFFYIIARQLKLTIKAMVCSELSTEEANELDELKKLNLEFNTNHLTTKTLLSKDDKDVEFKNLYLSKVGGSFNDILSYYDKINHYIVNEDQGDELSKFEKLWLVYIDVNHGFYHIASPINLKIGSLVLPHYDLFDFVEEPSSILGSIKNYIHTETSMFKLISKMVELTQPSKIKELSGLGTLEEFKGDRYISSYIIRNEDLGGKIIEWEDYIASQSLMLTKLYDEIIYELEP